MTDIKTGGPSEGSLQFRASDRRSFSPYDHAEPDSLLHKPVSIPPELARSYVENNPTEGPKYRRERGQVTKGQIAAAVALVALTGAAIPNMPAIGRYGEKIFKPFGAAKHHNAPAPKPPTGIEIRK